jgi:Mg-chelatase subunit ChlD
MSTNNVISVFRRVFKNDRPTTLDGEVNVHQNRQSTCGSRHSILDIDVSPSMLSRDWKPSRLKAAKEAANAFLKRLASEEPDAMVSIITYGRKGKLLSDFTSVTMYNELARIIHSARTICGTNITAALETAWDVLEHCHGPKQVVLLTDGCHNTGPDPRPTSDRLRDVAVVECIGIGGTPRDVDEELLKYIASPYPDGTKRYRWIGDKERLVQHFHNLAGRIVRA